NAIHLWVIFDAPVPTADVFRFARWLIRDWKTFGLAEEPETFPKQASLGHRKFGNWVRLWGRHHTNDHWTKVWDGEIWLEGLHACHYIVQTTGDTAEKVPAEAREYKPPKEKAPVKGKAASASKAPVGTGKPHVKMVRGGDGARVFQMVVPPSNATLAADAIKH